MARKKFKDYLKTVWKYRKAIGIGSTFLGILGLSFYLDKKERDYNTFDGPIVDRNVVFDRNLLTRMGRNLTGKETKIRLFSVRDDGEYKWIIQDREIPADADSARGYFDATTMKYRDGNSKINKIGESKSVKEFH